LNDYDADVPDRDDNRGTATRVLTNLKDYDPGQPGRELVNVARRVVRRADRYTSHWDRNENGAADPYDVRTMLDHILLHQSLAPSVRRAFISHASDMSTSDHWPVVVDLEFENGGK
jgi:exonuclease III